MSRLLLITLALSACGPGFSNDSGLVSVEPALFSCPDAPSPQGLGGGLCVNEVQSDNRSSFSVVSGVFPPWVELYHRGETAIDLSKVFLSTRDSGPEPLTGLLLPGERVVITLGDAGRVPLTLDRDGDVVFVDVDGRDTDGFLVPRLGPDQAWARFPDGGPASITGLPTPNAANGTHPGIVDPSDRLYQREVITQLSLTLSPDVYSSLASTQLFEKREEPGDLGFAEGTLRDVGVRLKGGFGTFRNGIDSQKVSFKLDINAFHPHRIRSLKSLTLNGYLQDPSATHEHLTYLLYRSLGLAAPRTGFAQLSVNGVNFGLYILVESVDDQLLRRWYKDHTGPMYEGAYGPDFTASQIPNFEYDEGPEPPDFEPLYELADALTLPRGEAAIQTIASMVDLDQFTMNMAIEHAVWHWDGYTNRNNYRMYHDPSTDLFTIIPWGTDQTWVDGWPNAYDSGGLLHEFCLGVATCRSLYSSQLRRLADHLEQLPLEAELEAVNTLINQAWLDDPRRPHSESARTASVAATRARIVALPAALRDAAQ